MCDGTNVDAAAAVDFSLMKLDHDDWKATIIAPVTDAGGGGVCTDLKDQLILVGRILANGSCHSCSIYAHNLSFSNAITKHFGAGGAKHLNSLQLLFTCWAIEQEFELETWRSLWQQINNETCGDRMV